ncbi:hypothetical protein N7524_011707 [Penicillium chrysogenum]|nr:hypothetical protein N7524_011707 [Penicillium chrysogenum]
MPARNRKAKYPQTTRTSYMVRERLPKYSRRFYDLISYARLAPTTPTIPSRKVIRTRLREFVTENQTTTLRSLPLDVKLSLALDY